MQTELLNLLGGSGEKPWSPKDVREAAYEDIEYTPGELEAFAAMPAGPLADYYYALVDLVPSGRCRKASQLRQVIRRRGLSFEELSAAWDELHARVQFWRRS